MFKIMTEVKGVLKGKILKQSPFEECSAAAELSPENLPLGFSSFKCRRLQAVPEPWAPSPNVCPPLVID